DRAGGTRPRVPTVPTTRRHHTRRRWAWSCRCAGLHRSVGRRPARRRHARRRHDDGVLVPGVRGPAMSKLLVIEDETALRRALRIFLEAHDYAVVLAATGTEGLALASKEHPDAVILDLGLPDMDGVSVATALRGWSNVPIVVLS